MKHLTIHESCLLVCTLMLPLSGILLFQQYQVHRNELTPWKGGGMGMFSSLYARHALCTSHSRYADVPKHDYEVLVHQISIQPFPANKNLSKLQVCTEYRVNYVKTYNPKSGTYIVSYYESHER